MRTSQTLARLKVLQKQMGTVVTDDGEVRWGELLKILPKSEFTSVSHHSSVRLSGTLPLQTTILRWEKVRSPSLGILLSSEAGHHLHIGCESSRQVDIIWDQLRELKHPTWSELVPWLKLPRDLTRVEQIASDFIQNWHEQRSRALDLRELLDESLSFWVAPTQR